MRLAKLIASRCILLAQNRSNNVAHVGGFAFGAATARLFEGSRRLAN